ncbi:hypothetical protein NT017_23110 [Prolixibacter sp. NT017]|nr:hypothetical protein NT017_23110 [Prolixibacter sp. NT017]
METLERKAHWNHIYQEKTTDEVSWYQSVPVTSLDFVRQFNLPFNAKIIDIGGGDSFFVDHLLRLGYTDITVLDISAKAIEKARQRLGADAGKVKWIEADAACFQPMEKYDFWHDRAAFHFLTEEKEINNYLSCVQSNITPGGYLVIGTFSEQGPDHCSGIEVEQYSEEKMSDRLKNFFRKIRCITVDHMTPSHSIQNFIFCSFSRLENI